MQLPGRWDGSTLHIHRQWLATESDHLGTKPMNSCHLRLMRTDQSCTVLKVTHIISRRKDRHLWHHWGMLPPPPTSNISTSTSSMRVKGHRLPTVSHHISSTTRQFNTIRLLRLQPQLRLIMLLRLAVPSAPHR